MKSFLKKYLKILLPLAALAILLEIGLLSRSAALVFNEAMAQQDMLRGTITVNEIKADIMGNVSFAELEWRDPGGKTILYIPDGGFKVRVWDVLTRDFKSTTIQELTIDNALVSLYLDDDMKIDVVRHSPDMDKMDKMAKDNNADWQNKVSVVGKSEEELKEIGERRRRLNQLRLENNWRNFNNENQDLKLNLNLNNCKVEFFHKNRHYLMNNVHLNSYIDTDKAMQLKFYTGRFGGDMIGKGISINGKVDFSDETVPKCDLSVVFNDVDPSSLGFGMNIHDKMTLTAYFLGPITHPIGRGHVEMDELHIPGLSFRNVKGNIYYEDALLEFTDVTANVYDGQLTAHGDYNIDTRYYNIYGHGENLRTTKALPKSHLSCLVNMDIEMKSKGNARETVTSGAFTSDVGRYRWLYFDHIAGKFTNAYRDLYFYDVAIDIGPYHVSTDALSIIDGKLRLNPIQMVDDKGRVLMTYHQGDKL